MNSILELNLEIVIDALRAVRVRIQKEVCPH